MDITRKWYNLFGFEKSKTEKKVGIYSVKNEETLRRYIETYGRTEGTGHRVGLFCDPEVKWTAKYSYEAIDGDENEANVLILESPTGVLYEHFHR